jgi:hypothetical protein
MAIDEFSEKEALRQEPDVAPFNYVRRKHACISHPLALQIHGKMKPPTLFSRREY